MMTCFPEAEFLLIAFTGLLWTFLFMWRCFSTIYCRGRLHHYNSHSSTLQCYQLVQLGRTPIIWEITFPEVFVRRRHFAKDEFWSKEKKKKTFKRLFTWTVGDGVGGERFSLFQHLLMSQSQILEGGLRQMECVSGWSRGFGMYSPIQLAVITKGSRRDPICRWELVQGAGIGKRQWWKSDKGNMDTALKIKMERRSEAAPRGEHRLAGSDVDEVNLITCPVHSGLALGLQRTDWGAAGHFTYQPILTHLIKD